MSTSPPSPQPSGVILLFAFGLGAIALVLIMVLFGHLIWSEKQLQTLRQENAKLQKGLNDVLASKLIDEEELRRLRSLRRQ